MHKGLLESAVANYPEAVKAFTELKTLGDKDGGADALIIDTYRTAKNLDKARNLQRAIRN